MPFQAATTKAKLLFNVQHLMLDFRKFYGKQVAKALDGRTTYANNPVLLDIQESSMGELTRAEIRHTDRSVIMKAENTEPMIQSLKIPALP
jgi:hypothetical protein